MYRILLLLVKDQTGGVSTYLLGPLIILLILMFSGMVLAVQMRYMDSFETLAVLYARTMGPMPSFNVFRLSVLLHMSSPLAFRQTKGKTVVCLQFFPSIISIPYLDYTFKLGTRQDKSIFLSFRWIVTHIAKIFNSKPLICYS